MKKQLLLLFMIPFYQAKSQTITYANFSQAINTTNLVALANNSSYNLSLSTQTGSGINWNASGLTMQAGMPNLSLSYYPVSSTPYAALYPSANYSEYDPSLTSVIAYKFTGFSADSIVEWGSYSPSGQHEIFQNPDKHLVFPMTLGGSFTDTYQKTNYSNATTVSSNQTGNRTVLFAGFGTLVLPQASFSNVALVTEVRTNNLGPDSYEYTWYELSTGKKLLYRSENGNSITTAYTTQLPSGIFDNYGQIPSLQLYPNPAIDFVTVQCEETILEVRLFDPQGRKIKNLYGQSKNMQVSMENLLPGVYFIEVQSLSNSLSRKKLLLTQ